MVVTRRWAAGEAVRPPLQSMWHARRSGAPTPCAGSCRTPCLGNSSLEADRRCRFVRSFGLISTLSSPLGAFRG